MYRYEKLLLGTAIAAVLCAAGVLAWANAGNAGCPLSGARAGCSTQTAPKTQACACCANLTQGQICAECCCKALGLTGKQKEGWEKAVQSYNEKVAAAQKQLGAYAAKNLSQEQSKQVLACLNSKCDTCKCGVCPLVPGTEGKTSGCPLR